ncbi:hypothetical protein HUG21_000007 [Listeria monocytogenes]|uniref:hypothetical protein n=1 Tax=Listeria monocytogenes TaxID=1639 RepID=UPI00074D6344|nr:hypothetical protein [Listeria monocytogenes]AVU89670.1 hypothetical protein C0Z06_06595 [Listeria monocytogenes]EAC3455813.1 hypothetical protein [Listeria monocytogenes]EAC4345296.1 hypothetical protein [Listeria monocytogenes]EAC4830303.1 hypothetical protein [Listeria monocytogenes]EAD0776618.1 hypothetical protein [Listeria monocytogenes]
MKVIYFYKDSDGNNIPFAHGDTPSGFPYPEKELEQINQDLPATKNNLFMSYQGIIYKLDTEVIFNHL